MTAMCPICRASDLRAVPFDRMPDIEKILSRRGLGTDYGWFLCMQCGNAAPNQQPDRAVLSEYWQTNRTSVDDEAAWEYRHRIARIGGERSWEVFAPLHNGGVPGRFLDIGCGLGATVRRFQDGGWSAAGIDADSTTKVHHAKLGIETRIGQIEDQVWSAGFNLIQIAYAIYFITDPEDYLRRLKDILTPDGVLAIVIADHLASTQRGGPSYLHTFLPTAESLQYALWCAGYQTVLCKRVKDSYFVAAKVGPAEPPKIDAVRILNRHRTRELRWRSIGAPRAKLRHLAGLMLGR